MWYRIPEQQSGGLTTNASMIALPCEKTVNGEIHFRSGNFNNSVWAEEEIVLGRNPKGDLNRLKAIKKG